jgi:hypothetical protein
VICNIGYSSRFVYQKIKLNQDYSCFLSAADFSFGTSSLLFMWSATC